MLLSASPSYISNFDNELNITIFFFSDRSRIGLYSALKVSEDIQRTDIPRGIIRYHFPIFLLVLLLSLSLSPSSLFFPLFLPLPVNARSEASR